MRSIHLSLALSCFAVFGCASLHAPIGGGAPVAFNVRDFGATGDGRTLDTTAINDAIAAANRAGGGTVDFPAGTYLSASIHLQSNVTLYLGQGAVIEAANAHVVPYDPPEPRPDVETKFQDYGHSYFHNSLLWGEHLHDIAIVGPGMIHGKGLDPGVNPHFDRAKGQKEYYTPANGAGNKSIALRDCRNVTLRDFSILHGGWFGVLGTGVSNLTIDNLKIDTNRDGMDIDSCSNVRISNTSVNSPWDDGICLKATHALGRRQSCENVTITNCFVAGGFDEGTLIDGTFKRSEPDYRSFHIGRIKLGTESNGDFKNIAIANCVFDDCCGLAIESVDGSHIEDLAISNITMRFVDNSPIFMRLGSRLRGPGETTTVGSIRRVSITNVIASTASRNFATMIAGIPGHPIEDVHLSNIHILTKGGGTQEQANRTLPEMEKNYPEPLMFGPTSAYGMFVRHAKNVDLDHVTLEPATPDARPAFAFIDVSGLRLHSSQWQKRSDGDSIQFRDVRDVQLIDCPSLPDEKIDTVAEARR